MGKLIIARSAKDAAWAAADLMKKADRRGDLPNHLVPLAAVR